MEVVVENYFFLSLLRMEQPVWTSLVAGGIAGTFCDISLFPLDTIKTRLQKGESKIQWRGLYQGIGPAALASAPSAAIFFATYDMAKRYFPDSPWGHGQAAACGETMSCLFKIPFEVAKQRLQAGYGVSSYTIIRGIYRTEGIRGCYTGLGATLAREIPFGFIQMPLYEFFKRQLAKENIPITALEACCCGAMAGGVAAVATTPIDVWKTRVMLGDVDATIFRIAQDEGVHALFRGVIPRVIWISVGGSIFFGAFEKMKTLLVSL